MRVLLVSIATFAACDGSPRTITDDTLISIDEGEDQTIQMIGARSLVNAPSWARLDDERLEIRPPCWEVEGFDGPPKLVAFEVATDSGTQPILVQVHPSTAGLCQPRLTGCVVDGGGVLPVDVDCTTLALAPCAANQPKFVVAYSDLARPTRVLRLDLDRRCDADGRCDMTPVATRPITDAPITFYQSAMKTSFCAVLPNNSIVGDFEVSYDIKPDVGMPLSDSTSVGAGSHRIDWNAGQPYGLEVAWCATTAATCRMSLDTATKRWCIRAPNTAPVSVGLRVWARRPASGMTSAAFMLDSSDPTTTLTSTVSRSPAGQPIALRVDQTLVMKPELVTADLGAGAGVRRLTLTPDPPLPAGTPPFLLELDVRPTCP